MIYVRLRHLPADSASAIAQGGSGWRLEHFLLAHVYGAMAGQAHPGLPKDTPVVDPEREKRRRASLARARERQRAIEAGEIT